MPILTKLKLNVALGLFYEFHYNIATLTRHMITWLNKKKIAVDENNFYNKKYCMIIKC